MIVQSFDHRSLRAVHAENPALRLAALTKFSGVTSTELAADGFAIWSPLSMEVSASSLAEAHEAGLRVVPFTINDEAQMRSFIQMGDDGVDGIITDRPDILLDVVRSYR